MARRKRRRSRYGAEPPRIEREKEGHALRDAHHHASLVIEEVGTSCEDALEDLMTAKGALEEGAAHDGSSRLASSARRAVESAERRFARGCLCPRRPR